jgi:general secretion pathway protein G
MRNTIGRKAVRRAFTLLEVLIVIVILGLLVAVIAPNFMGTQRKAEIDLTASQIKSLSKQLDLFRTHCGRYPTSEEGLAALRLKPDDETLENRWAGPYVDGEIRDAWGSELIYQYPGDHNEGGYDLSSPGPNKSAGDDDDITNWKKI